jgi:hypothetical protein
MQIRYRNVHESVIYLFVSKSFIIKQLKLVFYNKEQNNYLCNHGVNSNAMSSVFELCFFFAGRTPFKLLSMFRDYSSVPIKHVITSFLFAHCIVPCRECCFLSFRCLLLLGRTKERTIQDQQHR